MTRLKTIAALSLILALAACESLPPQYQDGGEIEVRGFSTGTWEGGDATISPNLVLEYGTVAWHKGETAPFHRMRSTLLLAYDPAESRILNAELRSPDGARAYRHVCLAPSGDVLHVRMATLFDDRSEGLTVVKLHGDRPTLDECEEVGVGPQPGLVESFDILFRPDGTYRVMNDTKAYLAGADLRVERTMNDSQEKGSRVTKSYP